MINIDSYITALNRFTEIQADSWVYFEYKLLQSENGRVIEVRMPQLYQKPGKIMRFIGWLFGVYETTTYNLLWSLRKATEILQPSANNHELLSRVRRTSTNILNKLKRKHPRLDINLPEATQPIQQPIQRSQSANGYKGLSLGLGPKSLQVAFSMDWNKDDPVLFNPDYIIKLYSSNEVDCIADRDNLHKKIGNLKLIEFIKFVRDLMTYGSIRDHYGNLLSKENTDRLRQMMLALMNLLNAQRKEADFYDQYAAIVLQICAALENCSNGINTNIESIFINFAMPKEGNIGYRVKLALQIWREALFRKAILAAIINSPYAMAHEAASVTYYYRRISKEFGIPTSVTELDLRYEAYAMAGQENKIRALFNQWYTHCGIVKYISDIIHNPQDSTITAQLFTDWVTARYGDKRDEMLDEEGRYKPEAVIALLQELEILA